DSDGQEEKALGLYEQAIRTLTARGPNRSEKEDISLGDVYFSRAMVWKRRRESARAAADYKEAASAFDGDRLTPLFQKEFPTLGSCAQQFLVAQCCTARLSALNTAKAPTPDLADAAAEAVRRLRIVAANPNLPDAAPPVPDGPPPLDRRAVDEILAPTLY